MLVVWTGAQQLFLGTCILLTRGDISTGCTTPLVTEVVIGIIGALVGASGLIIACVTVKWRYIKLIPCYVVHTGQSMHGPSYVQVYSIQVFTITIILCTIAHITACCMHNLSGECLVVRQESPQKSQCVI